MILKNTCTRVPNELHPLLPGQPMFVDTVVLAGVGTVLLMVAFFGGVGYFIWKDAHKRKQS